MLKRSYRLLNAGVVIGVIALLCIAANWSSQSNSDPLAGTKTAVAAGFGGTPTHRYAGDIHAGSNPGGSRHPYVPTSAIERAYRYQKSSNSRRNVSGKTRGRE